jgi:two-component system, NtrC family, sensor kinase
MKKLLVILIPLCVSLFKTLAQTNVLPPYEIKADITIEQIIGNEYWQMVEDLNGNWTIDSVNNPSIAKQFQNYSEEKGIEIPSHIYWLRYSLYNAMSKEARICLYASSDKSDIFISKDDLHWIDFRTGRFVPWSKKAGWKKKNAVPFIIQPGEKWMIYEKCYRTFVYGNPKNKIVEIGFSENLSQKDLSEYGLNDYITLLYFVMFGIILLAAILNFSFFYIVREREFFYYAMYLISFGAFRFIEYSGGIFIKPIREAPLLSWYFERILWIALFYFQIQFIRFFLKTFLNYPRWDRFLQLLNIFQVISTILVLSIELLHSGKWLWYEGIIAVSTLSVFGMTTLITFLIFLGKKNRLIKLLIIAALPAYLTWAIFFPIPNFYGLANEMSGVKIPDLVDWIGNRLSLIEIITFVWYVAIFSLVLFIRFNTLRKENAQQVLDKEKLVREKEMERSQLIEQQKNELEIEVMERTAELKHSLEELKSTQSQLIQSEKMASLGELTAGIAHEIQNPLNFVNNFSEVNKELINEMKEEIKKANLEEITYIANNIGENEEKICHHGKRADAIVKGMLQHSRASIGKKEPNDINALADEYLRLSYYGLREKDKSFNATIQFDFDPTIEEINIIPQDIGRVLLNLYSNAFYTISEKKRQLPDGYEPTLSVSTKNINGKVEIRVRDNGNGIPQKVVDKIFQPFFTTKPTGQGTGLGLSLSYDIIKAHGGEIKVETKEGEGTEFVILIPVA